MKQLHLSIVKKQKEYAICIGQNILGKIGEFFDLNKYSRICVITDEHVAPHFLQKLLEALPEDSTKIILPAGESAKTIQTVQKIWTAMKEVQLDRKSLIINLGGGVIGDMGGFAASTYMRGIDFINIPTTLLSQVDASVGGKTGIDFAGTKNSIGTFDQPVGVIIDTITLTTLPKREYISGFAEMIKHGLIADKAYFKKVTGKKPDEFSQDELAELITISCEIKKSVVEKDETESGSRKLLNFGHTLGHAIEALSLETNKPLLHGESISIGIVAEAKLSEISGILSHEDFQTIESSLSNAGLPISLPNLNLDLLQNKMQSDKKNEKGKINFTLLSSIGKALIDQDDISQENISQAIAYVTK